MRIVSASFAVLLAVTGLSLLTGSPAAAASHTVTHVVRPVTPRGTAVSGFTVTPETAGQLDCTAAAVSPAAMSRDILECSPSAAYAVACWRSATAGRALCMRDPTERKLVDFPDTGAFHRVAAPRSPAIAPLVIILGDGDKCTIRDGGAWGTLQSHPTWVGEYACATDGVVWAAPSATHNGVDESTPTWTVRTAPASGSGAVQTRQVRAAYFVGTAPLKVVIVHANGRKYVLKVWAKAHSHNCVRGASGAAARKFLRHHTCLGVTRYLVTTVIHGRLVGIAQSSAAFGAGQAAGYQAAGRWAALVRNGGGNFYSLFHYGYRLPRGPRSVPRSNVLRALSQDDTTTVDNIWYVHGTTPPRARSLVRMANDIYLQWFA